MEDDFRRLIDDPRFRKYHLELRKPREFNTFDVLRYADYEIRHSNVLAWLLRPADTHGVESQFLEWLVGHVSRRLPAANTDPLPAIVFEASNVDVWRERDHVDITVQFKKERCLIAIENKAGPMSSAHIDQVRRYERELRDRHEGHTVTSVLLTTSPAGSRNSPGLVHVGWESVHEAIGRLQETGRFQSSGVRDFIAQYLELVERWFRPAGVEGFMTLLGDNESFLEKMRQVLDRDGDNGVRGMVPGDREPYRDSLVSLVKVSRQVPIDLRAAVADRLRGQGFKLHFTQNARQGVYWLNWSSTDLADAARSLGCGGFFFSWGMQFSHQEVTVGFNLYQRRPEELALLDRIRRFMQLTPINRHNPADYVMQDRGYGWFRVYSCEVLSKDELESGSLHQDRVLQFLEDFMGSDASEYRRIQDYFQCLAFSSESSASTRELSP